MCVASSCGCFCFLLFALSFSTGRPAVVVLLCCFSVSWRYALLDKFVEWGKTQAMTVEGAIRHRNKFICEHEVSAQRSFPLTFVTKITKNQTKNQTHAGDDGAVACATRARRLL